MKQQKYKITGMSCAGCAAGVERAVGGVHGVDTVSVNLTAKSMDVAYDEARCKRAQIEKAVTALGFGIEMWTTESGIEQENTDAMRSRTVWALICAAGVFYLAMGHMLHLPLPHILTENMRYMALLQLLLTVPVLVLGSGFYKRGWRAFVHGMPNMDTLISIGTGAAFLYSLYSTVVLWTGRTGGVLYYESAAVVVALVMLGKYFEARSKNKTTDAVRGLLALVPQTATVLRGGKQAEISTAALEIGDTVLLRPGERVPADGTITSGTTTVNESYLTGESMPVTKQSGDTLIGGTVNNEGSVQFTVSAIGADSTLSQIVAVVEEAQGKKAPISKLADRVAGVFVPVVMAIAIIAGAVWLLVDSSRALSIFIAVLVVACPCSLGLATPVAIMVGTGRGAKNGVLIKSGEALETACKIDTVVLDKTGTVTEGAVRVTGVLAAENTAVETLLRTAAAAERASEHPVAKAVVARASDMELPTATDFQAIVGMGITATVEGKAVLVGNERLLTERGIHFEPIDSAETALYVTADGQCLGALTVADTVKSDAAAHIGALRAMGLRIVMLTGDNQKTARRIAREVGIEEVIAEVLPTDKAQTIEALRAQGRRVMMVGDGVNDAPALATADVGVAIGKGAHIAVESADIVLSGASLGGVERAIRLSRATMRVIKQNLFWAFAYNTVGIPFAAGVFAFAGIFLSPVFAGAAMALSSLCVVGNALRLQYCSTHVADNKSDVHNL